MGKYDKYFLMSEKDVKEYIQTKYHFFNEDACLKVKEIGDGNLNYVFRILDEQTGKSVIVKHSGVETRAKSGRLINVDRNRIEAEILQLHYKLAPGMVPKVFDYDTTMCCMIMEDLSQYSVMRNALLEYREFPFFADQITTYLVNVSLDSTDVVLNHKKKKELVRTYINPDLCAITEQLVYSEPFGNFSKKNIVIDAMKEFVQREIYEDTELRLECAKLKFQFMEHAQALIHGDLHSGSIFIDDKELKVFDPEFAFYGPMGYDLANVIAHLLFAKYHSLALQKQNLNSFQKWVDNTIKDSWDLFVQKFKARFEQTITDNMAKTEGFCEYYLSRILEDAVAITGCELIRRIVGIAKVKDITVIEDMNIRAKTEQQLIMLGKYLILNRTEFKTGVDLINIIKNYEEDLR